jgi:hypothetical protein
MEAHMPKLKHGHAPGHVREAACGAFEAWIDWDGKTPEPSVEYEIAYVPHQIPISRVLGFVWNCTDIVPGHLFDSVQDAVSGPFDHPAIKRRTYAACARAVLQTMRS